MKEFTEKDIMMCLDRVNGMTLKEVGRKHGVSPERVRQVTKILYFKLQELGRASQKPVFCKYSGGQTGGQK